LVDIWLQSCGGEPQYEKEERKNEDRKEKEKSALYTFFFGVFWESVPVAH
jgi:hypothetical protein